MDFSALSDTKVPTLHQAEFSTSAYIIDISCVQHKNYYVIYQVTVTSNLVKNIQVECELDIFKALYFVTLHLLFKNNLKLILTVWEFKKPFLDK
jgi:hypothetical protein